MLLYIIHLAQNGEKEKKPFCVLLLQLYLLQDSNVFSVPLVNTKPIENSFMTIRRTENN